MGEPVATNDELHRYKAPIAALLFGAAAVVTALGLLLPHQAQVDTAGQTIVAAVSGAIALLLALAGRRLPPAAYPLLLALGTLLIALALVSNGERDGGRAGGDEVYYLWIVLYSAYYFGRRALAAQVALVAAAYAAALAVIDPGPVAVSRWLTLIGLVTGAAVVVRLLIERVERLILTLDAAARTDRLTGVLNRRAFDERAALEVARARRTGQPLTLLLADLDRFKELNDRWGHAAGDQALAAVGAVLREHLRATDAPARIGGDEFAVLLPDTRSETAAGVAERLTTELRERGRQAGLPLEWSVGMAELAPQTAGADELLRVADMALYARKGARRNAPVPVRPDGHAERSGAPVAR